MHEVEIRAVHACHCEMWPSHVLLLGADHGGVGETHQDSESMIVVLSH